jgi:hypothetical protein
MKSLIWKEWRENFKWIPLPGLVILLVFLIDKPMEPIPGAKDAYFFCLTAVAFGMALGFVQVFFEAHGDKRSVLLHRPLTPSRIFVAKALAGMTLYVLALGIPFLSLERWYATPGNIATPYHWRTSLPWLADILSGLVYYFAGMLLAQREARWYGGRGLPLAAAFFCSYLVWALPEFWQALVAIGIFGLLSGVAAWGSFCTGGAYTPLPRLSKFALAVTFLAGLTILSMLGKQMIGDWTDSGIEWNDNLDRQGRVLRVPFKEGVGEIGPWIDVSGHEPADLKGKVVDARVLAPWVAAGTPLDWSYRNSGRFYVHCNNDSMPSDEIWFYDQSRQRLFGFDPILHYCVGSFGPDGFTPPGQQPGECFPGALCYQTTRWQGDTQRFLAFPGGVYSVDFGHRKIRILFTPALGETVTCAHRWRDLDTERQLIVVATDRSVHFLRASGSPLVFIPRDYEKHKFVLVGLLEKPERYFAWYPTRPWLVEPQDYKTASGYLYVYDRAGHELVRQTAPPPPFRSASYARSLFGLLTPMTEAATLVGAMRYLRSEARLQGSTHKPVLLDYLENSRYYIPSCTGSGRLSKIDFHSATGTYFRERIQAPWFAHYLKNKGKLDLPEALLFETGSNKWVRYSAWPPKQNIAERKLYFRSGKRLSFDPPPDIPGDRYDSYVSDPAHPVPYCHRPVEPIFSKDALWPIWQGEDQRFVRDRSDVLKFETDPLAEDVTIAGDLVAHLFASTSGSDSDWIVKLIDVYPDNYSGDKTLAGYELMVAGEVLRGRFRKSFEKPEPAKPGQVEQYDVGLHWRDHCFLKGHKIMVQVQSTWFPVIDRNPQKYVPNIFEAKDEDFQKATQRIYRTAN